MINLARLFKDYNDTGCINEFINLYGFTSDQVFLTKSGDLGVVLSVEGIDHECLDQHTLDSVTRRFEVAHKVFDERFRLYQYLSKRNQEIIPYQLYDNEIVDQPIRNRIAYFQSKSEHLFSVKIHFVVLYEGFRYKTSLWNNLSKLMPAPRQAWESIKASFHTHAKVTLIDSDLQEAQGELLHRVQAFISQLKDLTSIFLLHKDQAFVFLKSLMNYAPHKLQHARRKHDVFLDYYLCDSNLECHRGHLLIDEYRVKVLTLKEPSSQSFPLIFKQLLLGEANFFICTEWRLTDNSRIQKEIQKKRRHYHNSKTSLLSQITKLENSINGDPLIDESKESLVKELSDGNKQIVIHGNAFGEFSLTVVIYDLDPARIEKAIAEFFKTFSTHDAQLYDERYNLFNAYLSVIPGNYVFNLRRMYILNTNYADYSFYFTLHQGDRHNDHLDREYLAVLESTQNTPYFLNLHHDDLAHTIILGKSGSGKSFLLNFLIINLQKYRPQLFIFDMGGSYRSITEMFGGSTLQVGMESQSFRINPFCLPPSRDNLNFLMTLILLLIEDNSRMALSYQEQRDLYEQIEMLYCVDPCLRNLSTLQNTLSGRLKEGLHRWTQAGPFGFLFDNPTDTLTFSKFQCIEFEGMDRYPQLIEPLLFYLLHRANTVIQAADQSHVFKAFIIDEAWVFFRNATVKSYIIEALKTWRKKNAGMILATQSLDELKKSDILDLILECCSTKIFLANPDLDRDLYQNTFHLNDKEISLITELVPKKQMLIKRPTLTKVVNLNVDPMSYWIFTSDPMDNIKKREAIRCHGLHEGLQILARRQNA